MFPPADAFCRITFRSMTAFPVQAARRGGERRGQARFSRRETHLLVPFAVVLQHACCNGKGARTELAVPCCAFTMQESSKMIKRRTRKRTSGAPLFIGPMRRWNTVYGGVPRYGSEGGPFGVRENGIRFLIFRGRLRHGTWLFHLYSITNIQIFSPIFLLAGSTAEAYWAIPLEFNKAVP